LSGDVGRIAGGGDVWGKGSVGTTANLNGRRQVNGVNLGVIRHEHFRDLLQTLHDLLELFARTRVVTQLGHAEKLRLQALLLHVVRAAGRAVTYLRPGRIAGVTAFAGVNDLPPVLEIRLADLDLVAQVRVTGAHFPNFRLPSTEKRRIQGFPILEESLIINGSLGREVRAN